MIDPRSITDFSRNEAGLQEVLLFWVCAANKSAIVASRGLERFLAAIDPSRAELPFRAVARLPRESLARHLKEAGIGQYNGKARTMSELAASGLDLARCSCGELETIYGIGMKTSRCFIIHSRPGARVAGLDTHILKFLAELGCDVPKGRPSPKEYLHLERLFLEEADRRGMTAAELDLEVWLKMNRSYPRAD